MRNRTGPRLNFKRGALHFLSGVFAGAVRCGGRDVRWRYARWIERFTGGSRVSLEFALGCEIFSEYSSLCKLAVVAAQHFTGEICFSE